MYLMGFGGWHLPRPIILASGYHGCYSTGKLNIMFGHFVTTMLVYIKATC